MSEQQIILCGGDQPQSGTEPYYIGYSDLVDGYRHAWLEVGKYRSTMRRGRKFGHPPDPRCPECHPATNPALNEHRVTTEEEA